jgi:hypothetical protein
MLFRRFCLAALAIALTAPASRAEEDPAISAMVLREAEEACKTQDVDSFVTAFIESDAVRKAYTRDSLDIATNSAAGRSVTTIDGKSYADFPLAIFDYYYTTAQGIDENGYTHVLIEKAQSADNRLRVDWVRVTYDGKSEGGDDPGAIVEKGADPGYLLFNPTDQCWELVMVEVTLP